MNSIPEWFFRLKEKVWDELSPFIGTMNTQEKAKQVEEITNKIIREAPVPITTNNGQSVVKSVTISTSLNGQVNLQLNI